MSGNSPFPLVVYPVKAFSYGRLSQKVQSQGTGHERQADGAKQWCERKGIPLDESLSFFDEASGFHGHHRKRKSGGLRLFLQACEQGRVAPGSYLLVENLDRLSREQLQEGQKLIHRLLFDYRIKLVVLFSGMEYNADNYQQTHWSIDAEFDRAHSESLAKSIRSKDNWERRRRCLKEGGILTAKVPSWLKMADGVIVKDEAKAAVVSRVFDMAAKGFGSQAIAKAFNREGVPPLGRSQFWHISYVEKLLNNRAVLGEFVPRVLEKDGKRRAAGEVIPNYFQPVVTADQWHAARQAIRSRRTQRGRVTAGVSNLFTGIVFQNGLSMQHVKSAGRPYLQTATKDTPGILYQHFERAVLWWVREIKLTLSSGSNLAELRVRADKLDRKIKTLKAAIDADDGEELAELVESYKGAKRDRAELEKQIEGAIVPLQAHYLHAQRLIEAMSAAKDEERETIRREVRQAIRQVVGRIDVETKDGKGNDRLVNVVLTFKDGKKVPIWFRSCNGRLAESGLCLNTPGASNREAIERFLECEGGEFPVDPPPGFDKKQKCKELRAAGKSYKEIMAETGLNRVTIYRYVKDYVRPDRQNAV